MTIKKVKVFLTVFLLVALLSVAVTTTFNVASGGLDGVAYAQNEPDGNNNQSGKGNSEEGREGLGSDLLIDC
jgi:hypothetical protein